jgi:hypothetical protein
MPAIIGIDPGVNGAIVVLKGKEIVSAFPIPTFMVTVGKKNRQEYDITATLKIFEAVKSEYGANCYAVLEKMFTLPKTGHVVAYKTGEGMMLIKALLCACDIPYNQIAPKEWKKKYGLVGKNNPDDSIMKLSELYPKYNLSVFKKKAVRQGVADAILIGLTWWRE